MLECQENCDRTSATLLMRLRQLDDREAWREFVEQYTPRIYGWCRRYGLQDSDAADITQEALGKLVKAIRTFDYDPRRGSFRGWLKTVTQHAVQDFLRNVERSGRGSGDTQVGLALAAIQAPVAVGELQALLDAEAERELLREAEAHVQLRVKPSTWEAYRLATQGSFSAAEVAERLSMSIAEVYVAKSRVVKMLRVQVEQLCETASATDAES